MIGSELLTLCVILGFCLVCLSLLLAFNRRRRFKQRRCELLNSPLPPQWERILQENFPLYKRMPEDVRLQLGGYVNAFVEEKSFEACGGLEGLTDEMLVTIAGQACILLLNGRFGVFDSLNSVLLYPGAYDAGSSMNRKGIGRVKSPRLGESWGSGSVVLSWAHVMSGSACPGDGRNLVIHEFAHQLDQCDGVADGAPLLVSPEEQRKWVGVFREAYTLHGKYRQRGRKLVIDEYGAVNPAEFFAVATETFFEKPKKLSLRYPELYRRLEHFYGLNPLEWR